jgi:hypothetical protein
MVLAPMARDIDAAADPHAIVALHVVEEACEAGRAARAPGEPVDIIRGVRSPSA